MTDSPNELTIEIPAVVLIDHQPWVAFGVESIDRGVLIMAGLVPALAWATEPARQAA